MHGYRLKEVFDRRVSALWGLTTGQIYQSLATLERAALVESRGVRRGRRPTRRVYSVTPAGHAELAAWLERKPARWARPFREEILIRLMLLQKGHAPALRDWLDLQDAEVRSLSLRIERLKREQRSRADASQLTRIFLEGFAHHVEADLRSLQCFRDAVDAWLHAHDVSASE